ncbi:uncharacterized protein LOC34620730 [Cyclospora cayetanensis]|uniref:Uncharacterized protein LOC34620730 n=1 Tax=Cyclospora cayetanensis TaxID=88456 RepID=A0A6P6RRI8_9EIME|nr:uncharacterized protein LOC34620730 [Cyclospora cayetanensis]
MGSSWVALEQQQHQLECLHNALSFCEERSAMGRALRCREAAIRSRLLLDQLHQQKDLEKHRQQRNKELINEAVGWSIKKCMIVRFPAEDRLASCLAELHKDMQKRLSPSTFAFASTTVPISLDIFGNAVVLARNSRANCDERYCVGWFAICHVALGIGGIHFATIDGPSHVGAHREKCTLVRDSKKCTVEDAPVSRKENSTKEVKQATPLASEARSHAITLQDVLYEGTAHAADARGPIKARAITPMQSQQGFCSSTQRTAIKSGARSHLAVLGFGPSCITTAGGIHDGEECGTTLSIPEELPGNNKQKTLPPSQPQRLIAYLKQGYNSSTSQCTEKPSLKPEGIKKTKNTKNFQQSIIGEQHWLNLAHQVSAMQLMLLQIQSQQQTRRKHRNHRRPETTGGMMDPHYLTRGLPDDENPSLRRPIRKLVQMPTSALKAPEICTVQRSHDEAGSVPDTKRVTGLCQTISPTAVDRLLCFTPTAASVSGKSALGSKMHCGSAAIHQVRSRSGTPLRQADQSNEKGGTEVPAQRTETTASITDKTRPALQQLSVMAKPAV